MKDVQVENVKSKLEQRILIHIPRSSFGSDANCVPPQFWKRDKLTFRDVKGR